ncbi:MAG TPA: hypothetical protein VFS11_03780 [Gemmatimonadales bacterium]|nr:hypothetical protein [Gemmatimonadales bacterium]
MSRRAAVGVALSLLAAGVAGGGGSKAKTPAAARGVDSLPPDRRDATILGHEIFELVDRAVDYKGSHRGRPPQSFRQMGIDSLAPTVVRRLRTVSDSSVITVAFRQPRGHVVVSCEGNARVLEEAALSGQFTVVCSTPSGAIKQYEVTPP